MKLLVSGASKTVERLAAGSDSLGILITPNTGNSRQWVMGTGLVWAADNAAYSGFGHTAFQWMMVRLERAAAAWQMPPPLWVACPDVVGDHKATFTRYTEWEEQIHGFGFPLAFVAQNGATPNTLPWEHLEAVFIGGDTAWKTGPEARSIVEKAQAKGKLVHMGRVNTRGRYLIAKEWGVDTIDGSGFSQFPDTRIPMFLDWRKEA